MWLEETTARATCRLWSTTTMLPINGVSFPPTWATDAATQVCFTLTTSTFNSSTKLNQSLVCFRGVSYWQAIMTKGSGQQVSCLLSRADLWLTDGDIRPNPDADRCSSSPSQSLASSQTHTHQALTSPSLQKVPFSPVINREAVRWPSIVCIKARTERMGCAGEDCAKSLCLTTLDMMSELFLRANTNAYHTL